jgi:hypothetical protein
VAVPGALWSGKWSLYVSCGVFGVSETIDVSNNRCFEDSSRSIEELLHFFLFTLFLLDSGLIGSTGD